jgi:NAD(P)H-nitrite reductase large subunit
MAYVIIGGGIAGISAARAIRQGNVSSTVSVITDEGTPYYRPMIPKLISGEKTARDLVWADDLEKKYGLELIKGAVSSVDVKAGKVILSGNRSLDYSKLLVASGASAKLLDVPGVSGNGMFTLRTADDAKKIRETLHSAKCAVVIGGGFVGVKTAEALGRAGVKVTIIELMPAILQPRLDDKGANIIASALQAAGISLMTGETVSGIVRDGGRIRGVTTVSGKTVKADFVVCAVGTKPNISFMNGSGADIRAGLVVDAMLETSLPGIYAAGDVSESSDVQTGKPAVSALWSNAAEMGRIAGLNMTGESLKYPGFLSVRNATEVAGVPLVSIGEVTQDGFDIVSGNGNRLHRMLAFRGDVLAGAVFMGDLQGAGLYANLIKEGRRLKGFQKDKAVADSLTYADFMN